MGEEEDFGDGWTKEVTALSIMPHLFCIAFLSYLSEQLMTSSCELVKAICSCLVHTGIINSLGTLTFSSSQKYHNNKSV